MRSRPFSVLLMMLMLAAPGLTEQEDVVPGAPTFKEGDIITLENVNSLKPFLPKEFWVNRDFFFYEGMELMVGPFNRSYSPPPEYHAATERFRGEPRIGPENSLENYTAGQPFPMEEIDCAADPQAGTKIIWNFDYQWSGTGGAAEYYYSYWDRGEELPLFYEGTARSVILSHRVEKPYLDEHDGDVFRAELRKQAFGIEINQPFDARGIALMTYRYKSADKPQAEAKNDDTWVYVPALRRVRRISTAQRTDAVSGTDFTMDDLRSFSGIIPQYEWECLGEFDIIAPMNSKILAYPYSKDINFGPYGVSYASDNWEMRKAVKIRFTPRNSDHPYDHKDIYLDKETLTALYSFAYDRTNELWKIIWHNHRFSEDHPEWYPGWPEIPNPNDLRVVGDMIVNVQTGTGNRIDFWDASGSPLASQGRIRRYIDVGRLTKGR
ncbi:MAG: DUF1329 domain-containing protein [bacterium]|nr:DUF1329 domain-containing protein [bacterium]MCP5071139.1 DUF1329 domain-containing protein [bacterium]